MSFLQTSGPEALTLAQRTIELAVDLSEHCARPPRWPVARGSNDPALCAFSLISAASVAWVDAAAAHPLVRDVSVTIEAMAAFAAIEASIATGRVQLVICGSGPGTLGPLWALPAAKGQGATLLVLVPRTPPWLVGAVDIQEGSRRQPLHMVGAGAIYDDVIPLEHVAELPRVAIELRRIFARPQGAVVQLSVPTNLLACPCPPTPHLGRLRIAPAAPSAATVASVAAELSGPGGPPAFLFGSGAVPYRHRLAALAERWGAVHFATPVAASLVPGSLGVIGNAAFGDVPQRLRELDVRCVVVIGSRLGTASGGGDDELLPEDCSVVHVDADPEVAGSAAATRGHDVLCVTADIGCFIDALERVPVPARAGGTLALVGGAAS